MDNNKEKDDVRLVFEKSECADCKTLGVIKNKNTYDTCTSCNGNGYYIGYKIKEIEWFKKI